MIARSREWANYGASPDLLDQLSESQKRCLDLVAEGTRASKAIAQRLNLEASSVDTYLSKAAILLDAPNRQAAAEAYVRLQRQRAEMEENSEYPSGSRFLTIAGSSKMNATRAVAAVRWLSATPPVGGSRQSLDWVEKTFAIIRVAAVAFSVLAILVMLGAGGLYLLRML